MGKNWGWLGLDCAFLIWWTLQEWRGLVLLIWAWWLLFYAALGMYSAHVEVKNTRRYEPWEWPMKKGKGPWGDLNE